MQNYYRLWFLNGEWQVRTWIWLCKAIICPVANLALQGNLNFEITSPAVLNCNYRCNPSIIYLIPPAQKYKKDNFHNFSQLGTPDSALRGHLQIDLLNKRYTVPNASKHKIQFLTSVCNRHWPAIRFWFSRMQSPGSRLQVKSAADKIAVVHIYLHTTQRQREFLRQRVSRFRFGRKRPKHAS